MLSHLKKALLLKKMIKVNNVVCIKTYRHATQGLILVTLYWSGGNLSADLHARSCHCVTIVLVLSLEIIESPKASQVTGSPFLAAWRETAPPDVGQTVAAFRL